MRELKRHIHANSVDRFTLRRFVTAVLGNREPDVKQEYQVTYHSYYYTCISLVRKV